MSTTTKPTPRPTNLYYGIWGWLTLALATAVFLTSLILLGLYVFNTVSVENNWGRDDERGIVIMLLDVFFAGAFGLALCSILYSDETAPGIEVVAVWMIFVTVLLWVIFSLISTTPIARAGVPEGMVRVTIDGKVHTPTSTTQQPLRRGLLTPKSTRLKTSFSFEGSFSNIVALYEKEEGAALEKVGAAASEKTYAFEYTIEVDPVSLETWTKEQLSHDTSLTDLCEDYYAHIQSVKDQVATEMERASSTPGTVAPLQYGTPFMATVRLQNITFVSENITYLPKSP